jgi:hypothetical protein
LTECPDFGRIRDSIGVPLQGADGGSTIVSSDLNRKPLAYTCVLFFLRFFMARYLGPKVKLSRRVGVPIADVPKHTAKRQLTPPGVHGYRGRRLKDYGIRQNEKQKLRYHYSVLERQFRRYVEEASRGKGNTGEALMQLLEQRLDNLIRRAGFTRTVWSSRQMGCTATCW